MYQFVLHEGARIFPQEAKTEVSYECPLCSGEVLFQDNRFTHTINEVNCSYYRENATANIRLATKYFTEIIDIQTIIVNRNCSGCNIPINQHTLQYNANSNLEFNINNDYSVINYYTDNILAYTFYIANNKNTIVPNSETEWFLLTVNDIINCISTDKDFTCNRELICNNCTKIDKKCSPKLPVEESKNESESDNDIEEDFGCFSLN